MPGSDILSGEDFWDNDYKADSYATLEDIDGEYLKQQYPNEGFEKLSDRDESKIGYERESAENEENGIDIDYDDDPEERFTPVPTAYTLLLTGSSEAAASSLVDSYVPLNGTL